MMEKSETPEAKLTEQLSKFTLGPTSGQCVNRAGEHLDQCVCLSTKQQRDDVIITDTKVVQQSYR